MIKLYTKEVEDGYSRENFVRLETADRDNAFRKGNFKFIELTFSGAVTEKEVDHNLTFQPLDVITLSIRNPDSTIVTWHYDKFTRNKLVVSTDGACRIRAFVGRYIES